MQTFYIKYLDNTPVGLETHFLIKTKIEWIQTIFTVSHLVAAFFPNTPPNELGQYSLYLPEGVPRTVLDEESFASTDSSNLDAGCPLSVLAPGGYGLNSKKPLIIKSRRDISDVDAILSTRPEKKRKLSNPKNLVGTSGADFIFSDRNASFKVLADALVKRHKLSKKADKNLHPIPILADGPGSGKSRFLQELPTLFVEFVQKGTYEENFKAAFKSPLCINITFSNGTMYSNEEAKEINIQQSVCLRILYLFASGYTNFGSFYDSCKAKKFNLSTILRKIGDGATCIILGIDEVNNVYDAAVGQEKNPENNLLTQLFKLVGSLCCEFSPFFIPVLAGTVIEPMKSIVQISTFPPLQIPLPLLSLESCLNIFSQKNVNYSALIKKSHQLCQLISDCGGHCRTLEILYNCLDENFYDDDITVINWKGLNDEVRTVLSQRYRISNFPFATAIASSLLGLQVQEDEEYPEMENTLYQNLEEKGIVKLVNGRVIIPYFFVSVFLSKSKTTSFTRFWRDLFIRANDFWWQDWEVFNRNYIAFRLSLYAYLKIPTVPLKNFFAGAKMNIPVDVIIKIPSLESLKISKLDYRYPLAKPLVPFAIGDNVLNGDGAPFDSFLYLETTSKPLLLAFQMKLANQDSQNPQVISINTVNSEFTKINDTVADNLQETDFVCILLGLCEVDEKMIPSKCVVISKTEQLDFYGITYYNRLNNRS